MLPLQFIHELVEDEKFNARFPGRCFAGVEIETGQGNSYDSGEVVANWDAVDPPSDQALRDKFGWLAGEYLPADRAASLADSLWHCERSEAIPDCRQEIASSFLLAMTNG